MMTMSKDIKEVTRVNLIKNISPRRPTRGTTNLALQFPSCPLDATSTLRDGAHSIFVFMCRALALAAFEKQPSARTETPPHHLVGSVLRNLGRW